MRRERIDGAPKVGLFAQRGVDRARAMSRALRQYCSSRVGNHTIAIVMKVSDDWDLRLELHQFSDGRRLASRNPTPVHIFDTFYPPRRSGAVTERTSVYRVHENLATCCSIQRDDEAKFFRLLKRERAD